jgi:hypothetical protein
MHGRETGYQDRSSPEGKPRFHDHRALTCLALAAASGLALVALAGCQTPPQTAAPIYGSTVAPPATGMIGQAAPYGTAAMPGTAYAPAAGGAPMPGPATSWQGVATPAAPATNTWSWAQSGNIATPSTTMQPAQMQAPSMQQYGSQLANQANQYQQGFANQAQQYANQTQQQFNNQAQQYANQAQQYANQNQQQLNNQLQQGMQSAQQQVNSGFQQANSQLQQALPQMPAAPQQQTANGNWWPFSNTSGMPPARAVPAQPARY